MFYAEAKIDSPLSLNSLPIKPLNHFIINYFKEQLVPQGVSEHIIRLWRITCKNNLAYSLDLPPQGKAVDLESFLGSS